MRRVGRLCCTTCCALRWPEERVEQRPDGLLRITLKKAYRDGTIAVEMDPPLAALPARHLRTSTAVPHREVRGGAGPGEPVEVASRATIARSHRDAGDKPGKPAHAGAYRPWEELLARTFAVDVLVCPRCEGRMTLLALVKNPAIISRTLATVGEATEVPRRSPGRGPPYWKSRVLRRQVLGDEDDAAGAWPQGRRGGRVAAG